MPVKILFCSQDRYFGDHLNLALSEDPRSFQVLYFTDSQRAVDFLERSGEEVQCILGSPPLFEADGPRRRPSDRSGGGNIPGSSF